MGSALESPLLAAILARADDALILGHRLSEWCGHAPMPEEDLALANIGLDLIGQATMLYTHAAEIEGADRTADDYAFHRDGAQFRNLLLVEQENGDFAVTIIRQLLYTSFTHRYWQAMTRSTDATLTAIAAKSVPEAAYHWRHAAEWTIRLGDGTAESNARAQTALEALHPYAGEAFIIPTAEIPLIASGVLADPAALQDGCNRALDSVLAEAGLIRPHSAFVQQGGRRGRHSEHLFPLLTVMQSVARADPDAVW